MDIDGKVAVVTGAAAGTGRVIALALAASGAHLVLVDTDRGGAERVAAEITRLGGRGVPCPGDVCDDQRIERVVTAAAELGGPHILVNNAGGWGAASRQYPDASAAEWGASLDLNLRAPMLLTQRCLEPMTRAGGGVVVNIASSAGTESGTYGSPEYAVAKAGLVRFSTAAGTLRKSVRVNCIVPGWIGLDRAYAELAHLTPERRAALPPLIPPEQVADSVARLVQDDRLSGRVLVLVGGKRPSLLPAGT